MNYLDFELEIGVGSGREYPVNVVRSPAGEAHELMRFPFDELALENRLQSLQIALLRSGSQRRLAPSPEEQTVLGFGRELFNALLSGELRSCYDVSLERAKQEGSGLRLKLRIQPPELAALPWEFLYDPREAEYVCLSVNTPVVRYLELPRPIQPLTITPPLRILGMIASPRDLPPLDIGREKQRVEEATKSFRASGLLELTWLEGQTWRDLQRAMRGGPWHVFHFVGHGGFNKLADEGLITLANEEGESFPLGAIQLGRVLADHRFLRLALLNACEGARGSGLDIFSSTASILVRRGIPAVLAMQYEITDRAAIEFARSFYEATADGLPVDAAVSEARKAVNFALSDTMEWGTPVLYMRSPDGVLFNIQGQVKRLAEERAAAERLALEKAELERLAQERAEQERLAREKAEAERLAAQKAEAERIAREKAEAERRPLEAAEAERLEREAKQERLAQERAEAERSARERARQEQMARQEAEAARAARETSRQKSLAQRETEETAAAETAAIAVEDQDRAGLEEMITEERARLIPATGEQGLVIPSRTLALAKLMLVIVATVIVGGVLGLLIRNAWGSATSRAVTQTAAAEVARPTESPPLRTATLPPATTMPAPTEAPVLVSTAQTPELPTPAPHGDGKQIAFDSDRDGNLEVYVMNADGSGQKNLTQNPSKDERPEWSPDGTRILFVPNRDGNDEIYVMNADGSNLMNLTNYPAANDSRPAWSADGQMIAFNSNRDGQPEIYVMNADGSEQRRLTNNTAVDTGPAWSPDGRQIAFNSDLNGANNIYVMNADGSQLRPLTTLADAFDPDWSPDGTKIAFTSRAADGNYEIHMMNADGSDLINLTLHPAREIKSAWSAGGRQIAFNSDRDGNSEIYVMNADGSNQRRLTNNPAKDESPAWQP